MKLEKHPLEEERVANQPNPRVPKPNLSLNTEDRGDN
jgi:hypothetical protein